MQGSNNKAKVSFTIYNPEAEKTVFLVHGNSNSSKLWKKQVMDDSFAGFRLVVLALPGHGSIVAQEDLSTTFNLMALGRLLAETIKELHDDKPYVLMGFSMGGNIIAESLAHGLSPRGLVFIGTALTGMNLKPESSMSNGIVNKVLYSSQMPTDAEVGAYFDLCCSSADAEDRAELLADFHATQQEFRASLTASIVMGLYSDELELVSQQEFPILLLSGTEDKVINPYSMAGSRLHLWRNRIHVIERAAHTVQLDAPKAFNVLVKAYLENRFTLS